MWVLMRADSAMLTGSFSHTKRKSVQFSVFSVQTGLLLGHRGAGAGFVEGENVRLMTVAVMAFVVGQAIGEGGFM